MGCADTRALDDLTYTCIQYKQELKTSLTVAMENKHDTAAELLVQPTKDAGMDIDAQDKEGKTVLMRACADGLAQTAAKLIELGANSKLMDTVEREYVSCCKYACRLCV